MAKFIAAALVAAILAAFFVAGADARLVGWETTLHNAADGWETVTVANYHCSPIDRLTGGEMVLQVRTPSCPRGDTEDDNSSTTDTHVPVVTPTPIAETPPPAVETPVVETPEEPGNPGNSKPVGHAGEKGPEFCPPPDGAGIKGKGDCK